MKVLLFLCCVAAAAAARFGLPTDLSGLASAQAPGVEAPRSLSATCVAVGDVIDGADPSGTEAARQQSVRELTAIIDGADPESRAAFQGFAALFRAAYLPAAGTQQSEAMVDLSFALQNMRGFCRADAGIPAAG